MFAFMLIYNYYLNKKTSDAWAKEETYIQNGSGCVFSL